MTLLSELRWTPTRSGIFEHANVRGVMLWRLLPDRRLYDIQMGIVIHVDLDALEVQVVLYHYLNENKRRKETLVLP